MTPTTDQVVLLAWRGRMARCLIVDDHRDTREGYAEYLRASGLDVEEAADADAAVKAVGERRPDILLVDLQMPGVDGYELIRMLRSGPYCGDTRIVVISACVYPRDHTRAAEAGCDAFLDKPCRPDLLLEEVLRQLERRAALRHG